jgi:hypothetical protein
LCHAQLACHPALQALLYGTPLAAADADGNKCDLNGMAGPDNLFYTNGILFIAEDASEHLNNVLWAYDIETSEQRCSRDIQYQCQKQQHRQHTEPKCTSL